MKPPWDDPTPEAWLAFTDYESEQVKRKFGVVRAAKVALGLLRRPKMVLVADDASRGYSPVRARPWVPIEPRVGKLAEGGALRNYRWWTESYTRGLLSFPERIDRYLATPLDFDAPDRLRLHLCVQFCQRVRAVVGRLSLKDGVIYEKVGRHPLATLAPVDWAKEKARAPIGASGVTVSDNERR